MRVHACNADRQRAYRDRRRAAGKPPVSGKNGRTRPASKSKRVTKFEAGDFIAIDGEGWDVGPVETHSVGKGEDASCYTSREHVYALLAASNGMELYRAGERLHTKRCLDFLCDVQASSRLGILCAFAGSYDVNHMLMFGLRRNELESIGRGETVTVTIVDPDVPSIVDTYRIEYRARKSLRVQRHDGDKLKWKQDKRGRWSLAPDAGFTLWDAFGFFQASFVEVMAKWLGTNDPTFETIARMKQQRDAFDASRIDEIRAYNLLELDALVRIMRKLRDAIAGLGLTVTRWDGAGSIAGAMNRLHAVQEAKAETPAAVFMAARHAYSGGHIEAMKVGHHVGKVHHYDVNSAYPAEYIFLPDLTRGRWVRGTSRDPTPGFTAVRSRWVFPSGRPFYPLFYRCADGSILYPQTGHGWHWFNEWQVARDFVAGVPEHERSAQDVKLVVLEWWHFERTEDSGPFVWVADYYHTRQRWIEDAKAGRLAPDEAWKSGAEKVIKLGLNSLYGKTAQQVGGRVGKPPSYFQLEWAGYVTAGCRAKLMRAALQRPEAIISFATDGIYSLEPLVLDTPKRKRLGAWEYQTHKGMTIVMSGVYWVHDEPSSPGEDDAITAYARGFGKETMQSYDAVRAAWKRGDKLLRVRTTRLVGIGTACASDALWQMRGRFVTGTRELELRGLNSKRYSIAHDARPDLRLIETEPRDDLGYAHLDGQISAPYAIAWLDDEGVREVKPLDETVMLEEQDCID